MDKLIDVAEGLASLVRVVQAAPWVALDTEADSLHAYPEKLCLLQLSTPAGDELVDPLAGLQLDSLMEALRKHCLILHGADYDLRLLHRTYGFVPDCVFDTMLAARLTGRAEVGLERLAAAILGVKLEKGSQRANWARRPLTQQMVAYARNDTHHLKAIRDVLASELASLGRSAWHKEMCIRLVKDAVTVDPPDPEVIWRISGSSRLDRRGLAVLREAWFWRDSEARRLGRPPFFILPHDLLLRVAEVVVRGQAWTGLLPRRFSSAQHNGLHASIERALDLPEDRLPRHRRVAGIRLTAAQRQRHLALQDRRDKKAAELRLEPSLIASRATLVELAGGKLDPAKDMLAWQRELLGLEH